MTGPSLQELLALFPGDDTRLVTTPLAGEDVPEPYRGLLVHEHHMTVTVEAHHGEPVDVRVLEYRQDGEVYSRKILLVLRSTGKVVQFGIVRIDLSRTSPEVRAALLTRQTPVGRILIEHNVMRQVTPTEFLRVEAEPGPAAWFGATTPCYGRLAIIRLDGRAAVEVLEIVAP